MTCGEMSSKINNMLAKESPYLLSEPTILRKVTYTLKNFGCYVNHAVIHTKPPSAAVEKAISDLQRDGVTVLKRFIEPEELTRLQDEHESVLRNFKFNFPVLSESKISEPTASRLSRDGSRTSYKDLIGENLFVNSNE